MLAGGWDGVCGSICVGIRVDAREYLAGVQKKAQQDQEEAVKK